MVDKPQLTPEASPARRVTVREGAPVLMKGGDLKFGPAALKGMLRAPIVARELGFDNRVLEMVLGLLPPGGYTETHRHGESILQVLRGRGYTLIDGVRYEWQRGDTFHIHSGAWHQHFNTDPAEPAYLLALSAAPLWEHLGHYEMIESAGDDYTDVGDAFRPESPWVPGQGLIPTSVGGQRWMSSVHQHRSHRHHEAEEKRKTARIITRAEEVRIERSAHKGDYIIALVDQSVGFQNQAMSLDMHVMPPNSHTETHRHWEAILHILRGRGYALIDGVRYDWETGDTIHIQEGAWHQIWNTDPEHPSYILAAKTAPLMGSLLPFRPESKGDEPSAPHPNFVPKSPWA